MSDNVIKIEVDGRELKARPGEMLIAVTDRAGIYVPRFCYHEKLSIAANCRMCLVDVEKAPKPLPACATPVTPGMKVQTRSEKAIGAQKATMEFLLINHPLDCPICDQGGECELQDLAMGFGRDIARFAETKRVVKDKDIGPLVSTDMTRCIHCTRCVRFGEEIAGIQELGTIGRGDRMQISTYVEQSVDHELSGNIIDLCPVGALNSKPYRFSARAWEMQAFPTIAPHDCLGSHLSAHVLLGKVKRVVPRNFEAINETWLSDRDRFSYEGIYAADRLHQPRVRDGDQWRTASWDEALRITAEGLRKAAGEAGGLGAWVSPTATVEEGYLLQKLFRHLGSSHLDHRLRRRDFRDQAADPVFPWLGTDIAEVATRDVILVVGSDLRREVPLLAHRVRQAALRGARIAFVNPSRQEYLFPVAEYLATGGDLGGALERVGAGSGGAEARIRALLAGSRAGLILLGQQAGRHPRFAEIRRQAAALAAATGAALGYLSEGPNSAGLSLAGVLPHRGPAGQALPQPGRTVADLVAAPPAALLLWNVEPAADVADGAAAARAVDAVPFVVSVSPFLGDAVARQAHVALPIGTFAETAGTFVNAAGTWQSFRGVASPVGESRPGWKLLRVLGNLLDLPDCGYQSAEEVRAEVAARAAAIGGNNTLGAGGPLAALPALAASSVDPATLHLGLYETDSLVRRAPSLQLTREARGGRPGTADPLRRAG